MQAEAKKLEDFSTYLSLPSTKLELEEKGHSMAGKGMQNLGSCTISKDSFQISTLVCSTKLTQNGRNDNTVLGKKNIQFVVLKRLMLTISILSHPFIFGHGRPSEIK